jgi:hypothetical protein
VPFFERLEDDEFAAIVGGETAKAARFERQVQEAVKSEENHRIARQACGLSMLAERGCCCGLPAGTKSGFDWHAAASIDPLLPRPTRCHRGPKAACAGAAHADSLTADAYL